MHRFKYLLEVMKRKHMIESCSFVGKNRDIKISKPNYKFGDIIRG
jgi:hypothetical protein